MEAAELELARAAHHKIAIDVDLAIAIVEQASLVEFK